MEPSAREACELPGRNTLNLQEHTDDFPVTALWQTLRDGICPGIGNLDLLRFIGHGRRRAWRRRWTQGGGGHAGGFSHHGFNNFGGVGFYPGYYGYGYGLGYDGYGFGYGYPYYGGYGASYGYPSYGYGNFPLYGITNGYGYGSTYYDAGFVGAALGFGN